MKPKPPSSRKVAAKGSNLRWASVYLLLSEDAREIAVVSISDAPQRMQDFLNSIEKWLSVMREQADAVDQLQKDSDGESIQ